MARNISGKSFDRNKYVLQHNNGGSGCINIQELRDKFGIITESDINVPGGILGPDASGRIPAGIIGDINDSVTINGPSAIEVGKTETYSIANYEPGATYIVTFNGGTVSRSGATITVVASNNVGSYVLKVNDTVFNISVISFGPKKPVATVSGVRLENNQSRLSISGNAYSSTNGSAHGNTDWQVASDAGFATLLYNGQANATNKTSIIVDVGAATTYFVRVRYRDIYNVAGLWSDAVTITRAGMTNTVSTPSVSVTGKRETTGVTLTLSSTAFVSNDGSTHKHTVWQVAGDSAFTDILHNSTDTVNKVSKSVAIPQQRTTYYVRAIYVASNSAESSYSATASLVYESLPALLPVNEVAALPKARSSQLCTVAISGDGTTLAVAEASKISIYKKTGSVWSLSTSIVTNYVHRLAISANGSRLAVISGAFIPFKIYDFNGTQYVEKWSINVSQYIPEYISMSADGTAIAYSRTYVIGDTSDQNQDGYIFVQRFDGSSWVQDYYKSLARTDDYSAINLLSRDGTYLLSCDSPNSRARLLKRVSSNNWSIVNLPNDTNNTFYRGYGASISANNDRITISSTTKTSVYRLNGTTWAVEATLDHGPNSISSGTAMSADGTLIFAGANGYKFQNNAWVFQAKATPSVANSKDNGVVCLDDAAKVLVLSDYNYNVFVFQ